MKRLLLLCAILAPPAFAQANCGAHFHVAAYHSESGYETLTPGVGVICDTPWADTRGAVGMFRNSLKHTSVYAGLAWQPLRMGNIRLGLFGGAITGYPEHNVVPMLAGLISLDLTPRTVVHFTVLPTVKGSTPLTVALSFEVKL